MRKKLALLFAAVLTACGTAGILSACGEDETKFKPGDNFVDQLEGEFTYDKNGNLVQEKYTGKKYTAKYIVSESSYVTLSGQKPTELVVDGYWGEIKKLSVADIENNVLVDEEHVAVVGIKNGAFENCDTLEEVDLTKTNASLTFAIGSNAFRNCGSLKKVVMPDENVYTVSLVVGSGAFAKDVALTDLTLGSKLLTLGYSSFQDCVTLPSISIPKNITKIEAYTFDGCDALSSFTVETGSKLKAIQKSAFKGTAISSLDLSALTELKHIGANAFNATKLSTVSVPDSVTYIGNHAFYNCANLTTVSVPFLGNSIAQSATFNSIYGLSGKDTRAISVTAKAALSIPAESFKGVENVSSLTVTSFAKPGTYKVFAPVDEHYDSVNSNDGISFTRVNVVEDDNGTNDPVINKNIGRSAFEGCEKLATITLPSDVETIGDRAFYNCKALASFTAPSTVEHIGQLAFKECVALGNVTLNNGLKTIGEAAFTGCKTLSQVSIPATVTSVGDSAFFACPAVKTVTVGRLNGVEPVLNDNEQVKNYEYVELSNLKEWFGYQGLNGLDVNPSDFESIQSASDYACNVEAIVVSSLYTLPENTFSVSSQSSLSKIGFGSVKTISLTFVDLDSTLFGEDGRYSKPSGLPTSTAIGSSAFAGCSSLTGVTVNDASGIVKSIDSNAFANCRVLSSFTAPAAVETIGENAFNGCAALTSFTVPASVKTIGANAFNGTGIASFTVPATLTNVYSNALNGMSRLSSLTVNGYNRIEEQTQGNNKIKVFTQDRAIDNWFGVVPSSLTTLSLNDVNYLKAANLFASVRTLNITFVGTMIAGEGKTSAAHYTTVESGAFSGLDNLATLNISGGENVKAIESNAFENCKLVNNALFEKFTNVASIGSRAFSGCDRLTTLKLPGTLVSIGDNAFYGCPNVTTLNIGNYEAFIGGRIAKIFGADSASVPSTSGGNAVIKYYSANGTYVPNSLEVITVNGIEDLDDLSANAFKNLSKVKAIALNITAEGDSYYFTSANLAKFDGCTSLQKVFIPETVTTIYLEEGIHTSDVGCEIGSAVVYEYAEELTAVGNFWHGTQQQPVKYTEYTDGFYKLVVGADSNGWAVAEGADPDKADKAVTTSDKQPLTKDKIPAVAEWGGHVLVGWYEHEDFRGEPVSFPYYKKDTTEAAPATLYARWVEAADEKVVANLTDFTRNEGATATASSFISASGEAAAAVSSATLTLTPVRKTTLTLSVYLGTSIDGGILKVKQNGTLKFTVNNNSTGSSSTDETWYNTTSTKTLVLTVDGGETVTVEYARYYRSSTSMYIGTAYVSYTAADYVKPAITVTKPEIPAATVPQFNISALEAVKGKKVDANSFKTAMEAFANLGQSTGFTFNTVIAGYNITEEYKYTRGGTISYPTFDAVMKQVVTYNSVQQTTYFVEHEETSQYGYNQNHTRTTYFTLSEAQKEMLKESLSSYADMADQIINQLEGKWLKTNEANWNTLKINGSGVNNISTVIGDYKYDEAKGVYWRVVNNDGATQKVVLAVSIDENNKAHYYISLYNYNELWFTATYENLSNTTVSVPADVTSGAIDWDNWTPWGDLGGGNSDNGGSAN